MKEYYLKYFKDYYMTQFEFNRNEITSYGHYSMRSVSSGRKTKRDIKIPDEECKFFYVYTYGKYNFDCNNNIDITEFVLKYIDIINTLTDQKKAELFDLYLKYPEILNDKHLFKILF